MRNQFPFPPSPASKFALLQRRIVGAADVLIDPENLSHVRIFDPFRREWFGASILPPSTLPEGKDVGPAS